jgi:hypothetical protein
MDTFFGLDKEVVGEIALFIVAASFVISAAIELLKKYGIVTEGRAGEFNKVISSVVALATFVAAQVGIADKVPGAQEVGQNLAVAIVAAFTLMVGAKLFRRGFKWLSGEAKLIEISNPFRLGPVG